MRPCHGICASLSPLVAFMASVGMVSQAQAQAPVTGNPNPPRCVNISERLLNLDISVNGQAAGTWVLLERNGIFYAPSDAFSAWQVRRHPSAESIEFRGQHYFPLASVSGFEARVNTAAQTADLSFGGGVFAPLPAVATPPAHAAPQAAPVAAAVPAPSTASEIGRAHV